MNVTVDIARPFDIKDYSEILTQLQNTEQRLNEFVNTVLQTSSPMVTNIVDQINNAADKRVDHVFWRLVQLFLIIAVLAMIIVAVHNRLKRRELHQTN